MKDSAHRVTRDAVQRKVLTKGRCAECGTEKVDAHHEDYSNQLSVIWLCRKHHYLRHRAITIEQRLWSLLENGDGAKLVKSLKKADAPKYRFPRERR